jgi:hypothetical protein
LRFQLGDCSDGGMTKPRTRSSETALCVKFAQPGFQFGNQRPVTVFISIYAAEIPSAGFQPCIFISLLARIRRVIDSNGRLMARPIMIDRSCRP